ncbi:hypothetical protein ZEAMMB73_Zm00001d004726, partial [Zea mays]
MSWSAVQIVGNFAPVGEQSPTSSSTTLAKAGGSKARVTEIFVVTVSGSKVPCLAFGTRKASFLLEVPLSVVASLFDEGHSGGHAVDIGIVIEEHLNPVVHACKDARMSFRLITLLIKSELQTSQSRLVGRIDSVRVRLAMVNKGKGISLPRHVVLHVVHPQRPLLRSILSVHLTSSKSLVGITRVISEIHQERKAGERTSGAAGPSIDKMEKAPGEAFSRRNPSGPVNQTDSYAQQPHEIVSMSLKEIVGMQLLCCEVVEKTDAVVYRGKVSAHLSGSNCLGCAARSDLRKWAAAEKFQPSSKSSGHLNATGQKAHSLVDSEKPSNQRPAVIVKSHTTRLPVGNPDGTIIIRTDQYNIDDLRIDYMYAKFFVIKSIGEADVHKSIKYGVWSSSSSGNSKLDSAFRDADRISRRHSTKCPVFLFFS